MGTSAVREGVLSGGPGRITQPRAKAARHWAIAISVLRLRRFAQMTFALDERPLELNCSRCLGGCDARSMICPGYFS